MRWPSSQAEREMVSKLPGGGPPQLAIQMSSPPNASTVEETACCTSLSDVASHTMGTIGPKDVVVVVDFIVLVAAAAVTAAAAVKVDVFVVVAVVIIGGEIVDFFEIGAAGAAAAAAEEEEEEEEDNDTGKTEEEESEESSTTSSFAASKMASDRDAMTTAQPRSASARAVARPSPREAPITSARIPTSVAAEVIF